MTAEILYEGKHYLAAVKPAGMLSESGGGKDISFADMLAEQTGGAIYPVHRLDRETAGVMLYAKTQPGAAKLSALIAAGMLEKRYLAVIEGVPEQTRGEMRDLLFKDSAKNKSYVVKRERRGVKKASLSYELLATAKHGEKTLSLVRVTLQTGRTHQIRVQFSSRGMPLVGDSRYGSRMKEDICLFSERVAFTDPFTGKAAVFTARPSNGLFSLFEGAF